MSLVLNIYCVFYIHRLYYFKGCLDKSILLHLVIQKLFCIFFVLGLHYGGVSVHFVDNNFQLRVFVLACKLYDLPNQKSYHIREFLNTILEEFDLKLNEDVIVVSDNEPKMVCAFKEDTIRVGCSAHYINKVIEHAFELDDALCAGVKMLFITVRDIISYIRQIHKQSSLSFAVQNYCKTRFSTVYIMLNSFVLVYNELPSILNNNQKQNYLKINYGELEQVAKYLKHFHDVIEKLSSEKTPTIHLVIPYKQLLINRSTKNDDDHPHLVQLKRYLSGHLKTYWIIEDIHFIAMLLHPNLKNFHLLPNKKDHAIELVKKELDKLLDPVGSQLVQAKPSLREDNNKDKRKIHSNSLDEIFDIPVENDYSKAQPAEKSELDMYLEDESRIDYDMNPLSYWNANKSSYPSLARIAKRILAIPATNTTVERLFSHSGNTITNRRTRLDADKVNNLLFIKQNIRTLREIYPPAIEQASKRKSNLLSTDSTSSTTPSKKIKLMVETEEVDEATTDKDDDDEQF